jgi:putative transcription factor
MYSANTPNEWEPVVIRKKVDNPTSKDSLADAARNNKQIDTLKKENYSEAAAKNRNLEKDIHADPTQEAPEQKPLPKLSHEDKQILIKARTDKKLSQQQLAQQINENVGIIKDIEAGKVIQNKNVLQKINKILNIKLKV